MRKLLELLYLGCALLAGAFLVAICGIMMYLSVGREFGLTLRGGDEITAWFCAASAFLGLAHTFRHGELIRVELLIDRFTGRTRHVMELVALAIATLLIGLFAAYAVRMVYDSWRFNEFAQGALAIPIWIPQSGLALGITVLFIAFVDELVRVAAGRLPSYRKPPATTPDEIIQRAAESGV